MMKKIQAFGIGDFMPKMERPIGCEIWGHILTGVPATSCYCAGFEVCFGTPF